MIIKTKLWEFGFENAADGEFTLVITINDKQVARKFLEERLDKSSGNEFLIVTKEDMDGLHA